MPTDADGVTTDNAATLPSVWPVDVGRHGRKDRVDVSGIECDIQRSQTGIAAHRATVSGRIGRVPLPRDVPTKCIPGRVLPWIAMPLVLVAEYGHVEQCWLVDSAGSGVASHGRIGKGRVLALASIGQVRATGGYGRISTSRMRANCDEIAPGWRRGTCPRGSVISRRRDCHVPPGRSRTDQRPEAGQPRAPNQRSACPFGATGGRGVVAVSRRWISPHAGEVVG